MFQCQIYLSYVRFFLCNLNSNIDNNFMILNYAKFGYLSHDITVRIIWTTRSPHYKISFTWWTRHWTLNREDQSSDSSMLQNCIYKMWSPMLLMLSVIWFDEVTDWIYKNQIPLTGLIMILCLLLHIRWSLIRLYSPVMCSDDRNVLSV